MPLPVLGAIVGVLGGISAIVGSLASEGWTRYLLIIGFLGLDTGIGAFLGVYFVEGLVEGIFNLLFGFNLTIPKLSGFSLLFILAVLSPLFWYSLKH